MAFHGWGKVCVARPTRGLAGRRGFRSGFSRLPADPTEPDDGQPWHPRRTRPPLESGRDLVITSGCGTRRDDPEHRMVGGFRECIER